MTLVCGWFQRPRSRSRAQSQSQRSARINRREKDGGNCPNRLCFYCCVHTGGGKEYEPARKGQQRSLFFKVSLQCVSSKCVNGSPEWMKFQRRREASDATFEEEGVWSNRRRGKEVEGEKKIYMTTSILLLKPAESKHGWDGDISPQQ